MPTSMQLRCRRVCPKTSHLLRREGGRASTAFPVPEQNRALRIVRSFPDFPYQWRSGPTSFYQAMIYIGPAERHSRAEWRRSFAERLGCSASSKGGSCSQVEVVPPPSSVFRYPDPVVLILLQSPDCCACVRQALLSSERAFRLALPWPYLVGLEACAHQGDLVRTGSEVHSASSAAPLALIRWMRSRHRDQRQR